MPPDDLGTRNYLSIAPDLSKLYFSGGNTYEKSHEYDTLLVEDINIPVTIKNISNQDLAVTAERIWIIIAENKKMREKVAQARLRLRVDPSNFILKPGATISAIAKCNVSWIEDNWGYKLGEKVAIVVDGHVVSTSKVFDCYSAPFELPSLPPGEPSQSGFP
jgi:hypothetical protein